MRGRIWIFLRGLCGFVCLKAKLGTALTYYWSSARQTRATQREIRRDSLAGRRDVDRSLAVVAERDASGLHTRIKPSSMYNKQDRCARRSGGKCACEKNPWILGPRLQVRFIRVCESRSFLSITNSSKGTLLVSMTRNLIPRHFVSICGFECLASRLLH